MKENVSFATKTHESTKRNYLDRVVRGDKPECASVARKFSKDYWDGERKYGYGGYSYDGRWSAVAERIVSHYKLAGKVKILDVGCGKGFLLHELRKILPESSVHGIDISSYAIENSIESVRPFLKHGNATSLPFEDKTFDLVISLMTLHNLYIFDLFKALKEVQRVTKNHSYISVESYRNEVEKANLLNWQLTCESFYTPEEWIWIFNECGITCDYEFLFFT